MNRKSFLKLGLLSLVASVLSSVAKAEVIQDTSFGPLYIHEVDYTDEVHQNIFESFTSKGEEYYRDGRIIHSFKIRYNKGERTKITVKTYTVESRNEYFRQCKEAWNFRKKNNIPRTAILKKDVLGNYYISSYKSYEYFKGTEPLKNKTVDLA